MPIYEYRCRDCGRKSSFLVLSIDHPPPIVCRHCTGSDLEKLVSRVAILHSEEDRLERMADSADAAGIDEGDPHSVARWMKKMGGEMGDELGEDFDRSLEAAGGPSEADGEAPEIGPGPSPEDEPGED